MNQKDKRHTYQKLENLVDALHERVHQETGKGRPVRVTKVGENMKQEELDRMKELVKKEFYISCNCSPFSDIHELIGLTPKAIAEIERLQHKNKLLNKLLKTAISLISFVERYEDISAYDCVDGD